MVKQIRLLPKKLGNRRTGSPWAGRVTELAFLGALFVLGLTLLSDLIMSHIGLGGAPMFDVSYGLGYWLYVAVVTSFFLIGGGGMMMSLFYVRTSVERRSALAKSAGNLDLVSEVVPMPRDYPGLPPDENLTNSPGTVLAYRLPTFETPLWQSLISTTFALAWNGMTIVLAVWAWRSYMAGRPEWFLTGLVSLFAAVGIWSVVFLVRHVLFHTGMGATIIETSHHPLRPGGRYQLLLSQAGHLRMKRLMLHLICEEEATYRQGTDVRTERRIVFRSTLVRQTNFAIEPGVNFEKELEFSIPEDAMHSFQTPHNAVVWKLVVEGQAENWPEFVRSFPIIVYPPLVATIERRIDGSSTTRSSSKLATAISRSANGNLTNGTATISEPSTVSMKAPGEATVVLPAPTPASARQGIGA